MRKIKYMVIMLLLFCSVSISASAKENENTLENELAYLRVAMQENIWSMLSEEQQENTKMLLLDAIKQEMGMEGKIIISYYEDSKTTAIRENSYVLFTDCRTIHINKATTMTPQQYVMCLSHEARHLWQSKYRDSKAIQFRENILNYDVRNIQYGNHDYYQYYFNQPVEVDARNFADYFYNLIYVEESN